MDDSAFLHSSESAPGPSGSDKHRPPQGRREEARAEERVNAQDRDSSSGRDRPRSAHPEYEPQGESDFDALPVGYLRLSEEGVVETANQAAADLLGLSRERLLSQPLRLLIGPADGSRLSAHLHECFSSDQVVVLDVALEDRPEGRRNIRLTSRRIAENPDRPPVVHTALTDITELKQSQDRLLAANTELEAFAYSISHDLRAPLVTITNYSEYLNQERTQELGDFGRDIVQRIKRAAQRMDDVLQNLLIYSRVSRAETFIEVIDLDEAVRELLTQLNGVIRERQAIIDVNGPLPRVRASRDLLDQVLSNLLTNALKYTPRDRAPRVRISARQSEGEVILSVSDEGIGIAPEYHERIFKMFERLHPQNAYPGTGIGLSVVRRAVERMKGRIWVESESGHGSRFFVSLPQP